MASRGSEATTTLFTAVEIDLSRNWPCATRIDNAVGCGLVRGDGRLRNIVRKRVHRHVIEAVLKAVDGLLHEGAHQADVLAAAREDATHRRDRPRNCFAKDQCARLDICTAPRTRSSGGYWATAAACSTKAMLAEWNNVSMSHRATETPSPRPAASSHATGLAAVTCIAEWWGPCESKDARFAASRRRRARLSSRFHTR